MADATSFGTKAAIVRHHTAGLSVHMRSLDFILDTMPYKQKHDGLIGLLKQAATYCIVGVGKVAEPCKVGPYLMMAAPKSYTSS